MKINKLDKNFGLNARNLIEQTKEKRERDLLLLDAVTRYKNFLIEFPGMEQRIKQGIIASYLGIQPETLSRIRKKIIF